MRNVAQHPRVQAVIERCSTLRQHIESRVAALLAQLLVIWARFVATGQQRVQRLGLDSRVAMMQAHTANGVRLVRRFQPYLRPQAPLIAGGSLALLGEIAMRLLEPWPLKLLVDYVLVPQVTGLAARPLQLDPPLLIAVAALMVLVVAGSRALLAYLSTVALALAGNRVMIELRADLYRHIQRLSLSYHSKARTGDLINRLTGDIGRLQEVTVTAMLPLTANLLTLVGMLAVMLWMNVQLALLALMVIPIFLLTMNRMGKQIRTVAREERKREGALAASAAETLGAIKVVQALGLEPLLERAFARHNQKSLSEGVRGRRLAAGLERRVDGLVALGTALVLWYGATLVLRGDMLLGDLLVFTAYLKSAFKPMRDLSKYAGRIAKASASGERVLEVLDTTPEIRDLPGAAPAPRLRGEVTFDQVSFAYTPGTPVLHDLCLTIAPGTRVALVGPSGGGKSTLASLLLRFYTPTAGRLLIDGRDVRAYTLASLRRQMAVVLQESVLFATSVRENIAYGAPGASFDEVIAAAKLANAHEFILQLPQGYATILGERGATLSGGQRQRIAIARAAIRRAPIILLDEPTTGLDQANERAVSEALEQLTMGRTTFMIAHDLRTVEHVDLILYMEGGEVRERGTHADLLAADGNYAALYRMQREERLHSTSEEQRYVIVR
ncbi:ABC transporter ATP-binding protein [Candidatus Chloroploca sp. M-50]|uniref:ABC transporter ATP-binding protein n=2 Tax=Candidatus Chloroploca mongolica TaxID=2528176 RepID=A0ABS4D6V2_9CHLR|nr:ABC transporter ATP-binding protein [Candidatus Chloroploca mongolica]MBP1465164.1 ABC transporter ATP-binding protein [Candidatus Chloroploca mongolica]